MLKCQLLCICLFFAALWSPAGKGLNSWLSCVLCFLVFCHFPIWCFGSGMVNDCIYSGSMTSCLLLFLKRIVSSILNTYNICSGWEMRFKVNSYLEAWQTWSQLGDYVQWFSLFVCFALIEVYVPSQQHFSQIALPLKLWDLYSTYNTWRSTNT